MQSQLTHSYNQRPVRRQRTVRCPQLFQSTSLVPWYESLQRKCAERLLSEPRKNVRLCAGGVQRQLRLC